MSGANLDPTYGFLDVTATDDSLQASFARGAGGALSDSFTISKAVTGPNVPPVAAFTSSCVDLVCSFNGSTSSDPDGTITSYAWDFGDGTTGTGATVSHPYTSANSYTVGLTVTDNAGGTASATRNAAPTAPPTTTTYVADAFSRTLASGLGSAPTGGAYSYNTAASTFKVADGKASVSVVKGNGPAAYLAGVSAPSTDLRLAFGVDSPVTGSGLYLSAYGRRVAGQGAYASQAPGQQPRRGQCRARPDPRQRRGRRAAAGRHHPRLDLRGR